MNVHDLIQFLDRSGSGWQGIVILSGSKVKTIRYQFNGTAFSHLLDSSEDVSAEHVSGIKLEEQ